MLIMFAVSIYQKHILFRNEHSYRFRFTLVIQMVDYKHANSFLAKI